MKYLLFFALVFSFSFSVRAHELPGSTARVVLRDGLVTVDADIDIEAWLSAQKSPALEEKVAMAKAQAKQVELRIDGKVVALALKDFPSAKEVHKRLQRPSDRGHTHKKTMHLRWQAAKANAKASSVSVRFPAALGPVLISFVEPQTQRVAAGVDARFKSLKKH